MSADLVTFCIPLLPKAVAKDWITVVSLLNDTLSSLRNQRDSRFRIFLAGHEMPELNVSSDLDINFLKAGWDPKSDLSHKLRDKRLKRKLLYRALREHGGGYAMFLDADDLVSNRVVEYVLKTRHPHGYLISKGYGFDRINKKLAPIPGVWTGNFDAVCGSCMIFNFHENDLPKGNDSDPAIFSNRLRRHSDWKSIAAEAGRSLMDLPFPGAVYVLNHSQNMHSEIATDREEQVPRRIAAKAIPITKELIAEFSLPV
ncbi:hypothetical protein [Sediminicoccus sp. BL-A-41-H5]|uniref:hypothetical protein n=1 Tax=Sediminicoccus sp. BL-A-41-H5 TaxID=3421106 RepID=UPI003D66EA98